MILIARIVCQTKNYLKEDFCAADIIDQINRFYSFYINFVGMCV